MDRARALVGNPTFASFDLVGEIYPTVEEFSLLGRFL